MICENCNNDYEVKYTSGRFCCSKCARGFSTKDKRKEINEKVSKTLTKIEKPLNFVIKSQRTNKECIYCKKIHKRNSDFCTDTCFHLYNYKKKINEWLNESAPISYKFYKRYLIETIGNKCSECQITSWNNKPIVLELEHKDGNSENNKLENLCLLCPNCHSQTETYKGANKGCGRFIRRQRYLEGKSY